MARAIVTPEMLQFNAAKWNAWRNDNPGPLTINKTPLTSRSFAEYDLTNVTFSDVELNSTSFAGAILKGAEFVECRGVGTQFGNATELRFNNCNFAKATFFPRTFDTGRFFDVEIRDSSLPSLDFRQNPGADLKIIGCKIGLVASGSTLENVQFDSCVFRNSTFSNVDLSGAIFNTCVFEEVSFVFAKFDSATRFATCVIKKSVKIERYSLEFLKHQGLGHSQWPAFSIVDPVAQFRSSFSGIMQYIHFAALGIFLFPYVIFLTSNYWLSQVLPAPLKSTTLAHKFFEYATTAGSYDGTIHWGELAILTFLLLYNINRAVLLWKTKRLEFDQEVTGLPVNFRMAGAWKWALEFSHYGMVVNVCLVLWHTHHFFQVPVFLPNHAP